MKIKINLAILLVATIMFQVLSYCTAAEPSQQQGSKISSYLTKILVKYCIGLHESQVAEERQQNDEVSDINLLGHTGEVLQVVFSPNGSKLATISTDKTARIWSVNGANCLHVLTGHSKKLNKIVFSPGSDLVAICSDDGTVSIWRVLDGVCLFVLLGDDPLHFPIKNIEFSPDGNFLIVAIDKVVRIYRMSDGECCHILMEHEGTINNLAFDPKGQFIATASEDNTVRIWRAVDGKCFHVLKGLEGLVLQVVFSSNGKLIAIVSDDKTISVYNVINGLRMCSIHHFFDFKLRNITFSPNNSLLAAVIYNNVVTWNLGSGECLPELKVHEAVVEAIVFSPDERLILTTSWDYTVRIWRVLDGCCTYILKGHSGNINSVAFSPDGRYIATASDDKTVKLWFRQVERQNRRQAETLAMATHARLGQVSPAALISQDSLKEISTLAKVESFEAPTAAGCLVQ